MVSGSPAVGIAAPPPVFPCVCQSPAFVHLLASLTQKFAQYPLPRAGGSSAPAGFVSSLSSAIPEAPKSPIAFTNVKIFDGKSNELITGKRVIVDRGAIKAIEASVAPVAGDMEVLDGGGGTLMPGLIDAHWHTMMAAISEIELMSSDVGYINFVAAAEARRTLLRGFTSVRDMAGPAFGLKRAIDDGLTPGPRMWFWANPCTVRPQIVDKHRRLDLVTLGSPHFEPKA